jgi:Spy/CpxP family protein refolding chaperone
MCRHHPYPYAEPRRGSCAPPGRAWHPLHRFEHHHYPGEFGGRGLGVRRPLRFLVWKLGLDERQTAELAAVLNDLKTERAQSEVDDRRALALLADAAQGETYDQAKADEAARLRTQSAERLQRKVVDSLGRIHVLLGVEQRARLAYLLRTGTLLM